MIEASGILVVDDEKDFAHGIARLLRSRFPEERIATANSGAQALDMIREQPFHVMLTDLNMPGMDGMELMRRVLDIAPQTSLVMLTAYGTIESAVETLKLGAYDFLTKPIEPDQLFKVAGKGLERSRLLGENSRLRAIVARQGADGSLVGESLAVRRLKEAVAAVAASEYTVLIRGESGTGKELVARTIHRLSARRDRELVTVNCPAIPDQLLESELFGHVKGAFTGADRDRKGLFLNADRGTLLLDEIGDISLDVQTKLLRCLQEGEIRPVGASRNHAVDVRILASTNQSLEQRMEEHTFREDLYYRLNVLTVQVPPLRDRMEDIPLLAHTFMARSCEEMNACPKEIAPEALAYLCAKPWPGNVRELQNFIRRLAVFASGETVDMAIVRLVESQGGASPGVEASPVSAYKDAKDAVLDGFTRAYVNRLLISTSGNVSEAARISSLSRVALQKMLKRLEINADKYR
ncbi:sigma-54-dependent transcriptional regulator [Pseudodesulfovibrio tunisiensis]|uniref:sigma-54-dependent transcriptional regulator n=1 Tax=Pseudodesulfovibrio tunisiensis TaxID=463192 RepID=UPI001FB214DE|nr:sigma-54 dependent transcriptional regulator [Pseudodesulfovibrio tunisiensis]